MRTVVIQGSPHTDGPTAELVRAFLAGGAFLPDDVAEWRVFDRPIQPCDDCRFCHTAEGCRHRDLDGLVELIRPAALLVVATPIYNRGFPAPLKAVLDRSQAMWAARFIRQVPPPLMTPKQVVLLTAAGSDDAEGRTLPEAQLRPTLTLLPGRLIGHVHAAALDRGGVLTPFLQQAADEGKRAAAKENTV